MISRQTNKLEYKKILSVGFAKELKFGLIWSNCLEFIVGRKIAVDIKKIVEHLSYQRHGTNLVLE